MHLKVLRHMPLLNTEFEAKLIYNVRFSSLQSVCYSVRKFLNNENFSYIPVDEMMIIIFQNDCNPRQTSYQKIYLPLVLKSNPILCSFPVPFTFGLLGS